MGIIVLCALVVLGAGGFYVWSKGEAGKIAGKVENITPAEAKKMLDLKDNVILLDVRTKEEYLEKHIPGSTLIPLGVLEKEVFQQIPDKDQTILVYCRSGNRSRTASKLLAKLGYTYVLNLGGITQWPYETETGSK